MQQYIKIQSTGVIDPKAFSLIGASTKRADNSKIGFFGSGLKYSIAFLLRNDIEFKVFAGYREIKFEKQVQKFRDQEFSQIVVDGEATSLTTDMGIDWIAWMIIREIYCNALDEGECSIDLVSEKLVVPTEDKTTFFIAKTPEIAEIVQNWDTYFCNDRSGQLYTDLKNQIFPGSNDLIIYRKGIRCFHAQNVKATFHYNLDFVKINESRTIASEWEMRYYLAQYLQKNTDSKVVAQLLNTVCTAWEKNLEWGMWNEYSETWCELLENKTLVPVENAGFWQEEISAEPSRYHLLPSKIIEGLKTCFCDRIRVIGDVGEVRSSGDFKLAKPLSRRDQCLLDDSIEWLKNAEYEVKFEIKVVDFQKENVFGQAKDKTILLSSKLFEMGKRKIAAVIIEEQEHLITDFGDETRAFQDHFINKYVSALEDKTGKYL